MRVRIEAVEKDLVGVCVRFKVLDSEGKEITPLIDEKFDNARLVTVEDIQRRLLERAKEYEEVDTREKELNELVGKEFEAKEAVVEGKTVVSAEIVK